MIQNMSTDTDKKKLPPVPGMMNKEASMVSRYQDWSDTEDDEIAELRKRLHKPSHKRSSVSW